MAFGTLIEQRAEIDCAELPKLPGMRVAELVAYAELHAGCQRGPVYPHPPRKFVKISMLEKISLEIRLLLPECLFHQRQVMPALVRPFMSLSQGQHFCVAGPALP